MVTFSNLSLIGAGFMDVIVSAISYPMVKACSLVLPGKELIAGKSLFKSYNCSSHEDAVGISVNDLRKHQNVVELSSGFITNTSPPFLGAVDHIYGLL